MNTIRDHSALIDALGGNKVVADAIPDCSAVRVGAWKRAGRIPPEFWSCIIRLSHERGLMQINSDWLMANWQPRNLGQPSPESNSAEALGT